MELEEKSENVEAEEIIFPPDIKAKESGVSKINLDDLAREAAGLSSDLKEEIGKTLVGMDELCDQLLICLLGEGHAILQGVPGVAKTALAKRFSQIMGLAFSRIQFTPDLLPADILGNYVYNPTTGSFTLRKGPIFSNIILADELNRSPPKTQSALLECMQEVQATIEGTTIPMEKPFMVLATQNPIELEGTYPLPEAQKDRFLLMISVDYPNLEDELHMLQIKNESTQTDASRILADADLISGLISAVKEVHVEDYILQFIRDISVTTRQNPNLTLGASPRASEHLLRAVKARALISGRTKVTPEDVKKLVRPLLLHRIILTIDAELQEITPDDIIAETLSSAPEISRPKFKLPERDRDSL